MDVETRRLVRHRAGNRCEYCGLHQEHSPLATLQIEHIIPHKHGGADVSPNLALACIDCNLGKSSNLTGIDPNTGQIATLFNPRTQSWHDHFERLGSLIIGKTAAGRATVCVLNMNSEERVELRSIIDD